MLGEASQVVFTRPFERMGDPVQWFKCLSEGRGQRFAERILRYASTLDWYHSEHVPNQARPQVHLEAREDSVDV